MSRFPAWHKPPRVEQGVDRRTLLKWAGAGALTLAGGALLGRVPTAQAAPNLTTELLIDHCTGNSSARAVWVSTNKNACYAPGGGWFFASFYTANRTGGDTETGYFRVRRCVASADPTVAANWKVIYDSKAHSIQSHHLDLDVDANGNVYLASGQVVSGTGGLGAGPNFHFWAFSKAANYLNPLYKLVPFRTTGKTSFAYDPARNKLIYMAMYGNPNYAVLNLDGTIASSMYLTVETIDNGHTIGVEYPYVAMGPSGLLVVGWSNSDASVATKNHYCSNFMTSTDGKTWFGKKGQVTLPAHGDASGPSWLMQETADQREFIPVTSPNYTFNLNHHNPLAYNKGNVLCYYCGDSPTVHNTLGTFNLSTKTWKRQDLGIRPTGNWASTFFAQDSTFTGPVYVQGFLGNGTSATVAVFKSTDGGVTWGLYSNNPTVFPLDGPGHPDNMSGAKQLDPAGHMVGCFVTNGAESATGVGKTSDVYLTITKVA